MKILLTGGNGFIGKSIFNELKNEYIVTSIDKCNNLDLSKNNHLIENFVQENDLIIHLASPVGVKNIDKNSNTFLDEMLKINLNIFNLVKKYNKKIIYFSTSEVYSNNSDAKETDNLIISNPSKLRWGYASGKLTSEFLCRSLCKNNIIIRPFNITGNGDNKGVLYEFIKKINLDKKISIYGTGNQIRAFCDIRDFNAFIKLIIKEKFDGQIYNIGNNNNVISIKSLAEKCINLSNKKIKIAFKNYDEIFSNNFGDILMRVPNCKKMNNIYKSKFNLDDIINSML